MSENMCQCFTERLFLDRFKQFEQNCLVPVFRTRKMLLKKPVLDWDQRCRTCDHPLFRYRLLALAPDSRKLGDGLILEQLFCTQTEARLVGPRNNLNCENRITAEFEEVVVDTDSLELQYLRPDACEGLLRLRSRSQVALLQFRPHGIRNRQRPAIHLPVGG